jgi:hypothetical protein
MRARSGGVRCTECGAHAAADGRGTPITLRHEPSCSEHPGNLPAPVCECGRHTEEMGVRCVCGRDLLASGIELDAEGRVVQGNHRVAAARHLGLGLPWPTLAEDELEGPPPMDPNI